MALAERALVGDEGSAKAELAAWTALRDSETRSWERWLDTARVAVDYYVLKR